MLEINEKASESLQKRVKDYNNDWTRDKLQSIQQSEKPR